MIPVPRSPVPGQASEELFAEIERVRVHLRLAVRGLADPNRATLDALGVLDNEVRRAEKALSSTASPSPEGQSNDDGVEVVVTHYVEVLDDE